MKADNGETLELKEGIVIDKNGEPLNPTPPKIFVLRGGRLSAFLLLVAAPIVLFAGFTLFSIFFAVAFLIWLIKPKRRFRYFG